MFYYAVINNNDFVVNLVTSETEITDSTYISITEDQYTNGDLMWKYYKPDTNEFIICDNFIGSCDYIEYKATGYPITPKLDLMDENIATLQTNVSGKANISHTHAINDVSDLQTTLNNKADASHTHSDYANSQHSHVLSDVSETDSLKIMTSAERTKLSGIAENANNYTHPNTHSIDIITESSTKKILTADERTKLSGIAENANNYTHPATHSASMISGLSDVATSGSYDDLINKPTIPSAYTHPASHPASMITGLSDVAISGSYTDLTDKPSSFTPSSHTHAQSEISGLESALSGKAASSHTHASASTTTAGFMSKDDKAKLDGISANANNYSHPSTHPASMITGLSAVATSGSYNDLSNVPSTFAPSSHTHAQSEISGLSTALSGKANSSHTHAQSEISGLESALSGKASSSHTHTSASTTTAGFMSKDDKVKLDGIATNANNYSHPSSHPASMITGLSTVATSGSYADLSNKPSSFTPASHTHAQSEISGLSTALSGKASTSHNHDSAYASISHTHTASQVGAASSSHNHDSSYVSKTLQGVNDGGGVEYSYTSGDVLKAISAYSPGFHTVYAAAGCSTNPDTTDSYRYFIHKTGDTIGWIFAWSSQGSLFTNYQYGNNLFKGWKCIYDADPQPLWSGGANGGYYMTETHTVTPSKKLSQCRNGWILLWSDYDVGGQANNTDFCTTVIPKIAYTGQFWNGGQFYCDIPSYSGGSATDSEVRIIKLLQIYDNKIVGTANNSAAPRNDVVLRAVFEF